jgi:hypothetical protein
MSKDEVKFPYMPIASTLDPYYKNIANIMLGVTGENIKLSEEDIQERKERLEKLDEIIKDGNFVAPIFINGFAHGLYSVKEIQEWIKEQKQKRNIKK